jgi:flagellar P-ring protein precursor FlgI
MKARFLLTCGLLLGMVGGAGASRLKDIVTFEDVRENQLTGYGLVVGLQGTGDGLRNAPFTEQSFRSLLDSFGIVAESGRARLKNIAAVMVTADLPPFARKGNRIDVRVASLGDATSLQGGTLVMTPLRGADGEVYAVAQGQVIIGGFRASGQAESLAAGVPTSGRVPSGAIVEAEVAAPLAESRAMLLSLRTADFSTAVRIVDAINALSRSRYGMQAAREIDARAIEVSVPKKVSAARFIAEIENIEVESDTPARVVLDENTGTVVIGQNVRIDRVAVTHGTLTVRVTEMPTVVQPAPFSEGQTAVEPATVVEANQPDTQLAIVDGASLQSLVEGLNILGVKAGDVITILQAIKSAGALHAEIVLE